MDAVGLQSSVLFGSSSGGYVAQQVATRTIAVGTPGEGWASPTSRCVTSASDVVDGRPSRESPTANRRCLEVDTWAMLIMCRSTWTAMSSSASQPRKRHLRTSRT